MNQSASENKLTFEQALRRLGEITDKLEHSTLSLEDMVRLYDEANELIGMCTAELAAASEKVEIIRQERSGAGTSSPGTTDPSCVCLKIGCA